MKVLLSAYACEPHKGSEGGVGWNWAKQIARFNEVWVITRRNNKEPIERELVNNPVPRLHFLYTDLPRWMSFWKKGPRGVRIYYYLWQFAMLKTALTAHKSIEFDLAHHVTFVNDWQPALLSFLPIPFIWGPIGSNAPLPPTFIEGFRMMVYEKVRIIAQNLFRFLNPFFYVALFRSKKIIMINENNSNRYPFSLLPRERFLFKQAIGFTVEELIPFAKKNDGSIRIISVGQLIYLKGFHLAIHAFGNVMKKNNDVSLIIIGEGKEQNDLKRLTKKLGIDERVVFKGKISREKVFTEISKSDIFLFPSFEGGGMVVLEAMACGLPVVCLDYGGPGEMVTEECGVKVKPVTLEQTIRDLADGLLELANDPNLRTKMGEAGRRRVKECCSWSKKGKLISKIYAEFK